MAIKKKPTTVLGVLGSAANAFVNGKPQPPLHTLVHVVKAAATQHAAKKAALENAKAKPTPKVQVTPKPKKAASPKVSNAIKKGVANAAAPKPTSQAAPAVATPTASPQFSLGSFTNMSFAPHATVSPVPQATPAPAAQPSPAPIKAATGKHPNYEEAVQFLKTLGMKDKEARGSLDKVQSLVTPQHPTSELVRLALKHSKA